jgi:hypothetical protein
VRFLEKTTLPAPIMATLTTEFSLQQGTPWDGGRLAAAFLPRRRQDTKKTN